MAANRCRDSPPRYFPGAAKTIIALFFDRMFAFELKLPPLSNVRQFGSAECDEELGCSHEGWWLA